MPAQGWCPDPYGNHDDRWFSDGEPTSLVRDQGTESHDEPPQGQLPVNPLGRDQPPQERLPRYPRPAGKQELVARAGWEWEWWTVFLPGLLALAVSGFLWVAAGLASVLNCMDTCQPSARSGMSAAAVGTGEGIVFIAVGALLVGGLVNPAWRRVIAVVLWMAIALAIGFAAVH